MGVRRAVFEFVDPESPQRGHDICEVFSARRYLVRSGASGRYLPQDLPFWSAVYQQTQRWLKADVFEAMMHDLREVAQLF